MRLPTRLLFVAALLVVAHADFVAAADPATKTIVVDKTKFSAVYPAVWLNPTTGEITPLTTRSELPPEAKFEIWIEPDDPEFAVMGYPKDYGFTALGKGVEAFQAGPDAQQKAQPKKQKIPMKDLVADNVFYFRGVTGRCVIRFTKVNKEESTIEFEWRKLEN